MRVHILDDYDYDCEVRMPDEYCHDKRLFEVPDDLVKEYAEVNKRREELKEKILLIERQGPV